MRRGPRPGRLAVVWCVIVALTLWSCGGGEDGAGAGADVAGEPAAEAGAAGEGQEQAAAMTEVNRFLSYSAADSLVDLEVWAGYGGANSAWNFDGHYAGNATVVVPAGWRVEATYQTLDANVPHSAAVVDTLGTLPRDGSGVDVAFPGASTPSFVTGIPSTRDPLTFDFLADRPGRYWLMCGVPGHAVGGMWIWFEVSDTAEVPDFRTEEG